MKPGRNDPCICGSGKKYKKCCGQPEPGLPVQSRQHRNIAAQNSLAKGAAPAQDELNRLIALYNAGSYAELENRTYLLLDRYPDSGFTWKVLGVTLQMQGKDSLPALRKATELLPDDADAHYNLGNTLMMLGRLDEAEASYRCALRIQPDYVDAYYNLGNTLRNMGRIGEAEASYRQALRIKPDYAEVYSNLGNVMLEQGRLAEAEASYRQALRIKPDYAAAHYNLGNFLHDRSRLDEAEASFRRVLQIKPDYADAHSNLGNVLQDMGRLAEAEASYRRALQNKPDHAEAYSNLGNTLLELGRIAEAEASHRHALEIKPDFVEGRFNFTLAKKAKAGDENLVALEAAEEAVRDGTATLSNKEAVYLHFALGKSYDDLGDYEKAFPHFLEGCKLKRATFGHDPDHASRLFAGIMRNLDAAAIDRLRGGGDPSNLPIFVLGMPRSGTTLTEQIIASHPEVHGAGELPDLIRIARRDIDGAAFPDNLRLFDQARLSAWGAEYVAGLQRRAPDARRITDKMPENFLVVGLIHLMLPNAKIIHVNRNPVDTCLSCFTKLFKHQHEYTYDLAELGRYYAGYARLMDHWRKVLPGGAFLDVRYEDLVADQEAQSRRIIGYCGLEWNDACIDFYNNKRPVSTASMAQVRQPMYKSSVERWRHYEKFLGPLLDALGELVTER
ncbi:MAG: tetratricopeptide repeat protein [Gallionella sp.]|nr:tetratricopeptide repeat protein [Gallionella sp.]